MFKLPLNKCVKRNGDKWLVCIITFIPSTVKRLPVPIPALLIKISNLCSFVFMSRANVLTDSNDCNSNNLTTTSSFPVSSIIFDCASIPLVKFLQAKITRAPLLANSNAVSYPIPTILKAHV